MGPCLDKKIHQLGIYEALHVNSIIRKINGRKHSCFGEGENQVKWLFLADRSLFANLSGCLRMSTATSFSNKAVWIHQIPRVSARLCN